MEMDIDLQVGERIRLARLSRNMSQGDLAKNLGTSKQQLWKYEHGKNQVSLTRLQQIARISGVPLYFFLEKRVTDAPISVGDANNYILQLYGKLKPRHRSLLVSIAEALVEATETQVGLDE